MAFCTNPTKRWVCMIYVIATVQLTDGHREEFLEEFRRIVPLVRQEQGCLEYGPAIDVETSIPAQVALRPNAVTVVEKWESLEALQDHLMAPHMMEYRSRVKGMVQGTELQVLEPAGEV